jgi:hypothetical protein
MSASQTIVNPDTCNALLFPARSPIPGLLWSAFAMFAMEAMLLDCVQLNYAISGYSHQTKKLQ